jgi:hypothetical protein
VRRILRAAISRNVIRKTPQDNAVHDKNTFHTVFLSCPVPMTPGTPAGLPVRPLYGETSRQASAAGRMQAATLCLHAAKLS